MIGVLLLGCGSEEVIEPTVATLPLNDTPENTIKRFIATYEGMHTAEYEKLFTEDFLFEFSSTLDPDLVSEFSGGWFWLDESVSAKHLFESGTIGKDLWLPAAEEIELRFAQMVPYDDNSPGRDPEKFKTLFTQIVLTIQLPRTKYDPKGPIIVVGGTKPMLHRFFLVRGDAADALANDQPADDKHWYFWSWRDESTHSDKPTVRAETDIGYIPTDVQATSWGRLKAAYR
jgi:hypothetical protein